MSNPNVSTINYNGDTVDNITDKLLLKYDEKFNDLYNNIVHVNSSIMNKEELVIKTNNEISVKDNWIMILIIGAFFVILGGVLLILKGLGKIDNNKLIIGIIILILIYYGIVYYIIYGTSKIEDLRRQFDNKVKMKKYIAKDLVKQYVCPARCPKVNADLQYSPIAGYHQPTLRTDPQLDVWKYGNMPIDLYTTKKTPGKMFYSSPTGIPIYRDSYEEDKGDRPKQSFGTTYPSSTYYKCKWLGGNKNGGLPNNEENTFSSIPCSYRPNYAEQGKFICTKNPNKLPKALFEKVCNDVSVIKYNS
jgi:hypothetical protein